MKHRKIFTSLAIIILITLITLPACNTVEQVIASVPGGGGSGSVEEDSSLPDRDNTPIILENVASGESTFGGEGAEVDYSHVNEGYVMIKYAGDNSKVKVQITKDGGEAYTYDLVPNQDFVAFPLSAGDGYYQVGVFLNIDGQQYSTAASQGFEAYIEDPFQPFLRANQFSNFNASSQAVAKAAELSAGAKTTLGAVEQMFMFIVNNIDYDYDLAATVQSGYIPNVDNTLATQKGICFDYAALMTAMLRSQGIPCQLVVGYAGPAYHAWISVYSSETGKVYKVIQFNGDQWTLMDPTFMATGDTADPNIVGDGENHEAMFFY